MNHLLTRFPAHATLKKLHEVWHSERQSEFFITAGEFVETKEMYSLTGSQLIDEFTQLAGIAEEMKKALEHYSLLPYGGNTEAVLALEKFNAIQKGE